MITITQAVEEIISRSPNIQTLLGQNLLNISSYARQIKPQIEKATYKKVTIASIIMAIKRLNIKTHIISEHTFTSTPDMIVRSNLIEITYANSKGLKNKQKKLLEKAEKYPNEFLTFTHGVFENTIVASVSLKYIITETFIGETEIANVPDLSSITIRLEKNIVVTPGVYASILSYLSWHAINLTEVVSTTHELTIIINDSQVDKSFQLLKAFFSVMFVKNKINYTKL